MLYTYLVLAIVFEAGIAVAMKLSSGLTKFTPTAAFAVMYILSAAFLALATKKLDVGTGYAIWAGAGAVLIALAGIIYFKEPVSTLKVVSMCLVVAGIVGLGLSGAGHG